MNGAARLALSLFAAAFAGLLPAASDAAPRDGARQSLVIGRMQRFFFPADYYCVNVGNGYVCPEHPWMTVQHARSLAGRAVPKRWAPSTLAGAPSVGSAVLLLVDWRADDVPTIVAQATPDAAGEACLPAGKFADRDWQPSAPNLVWRGDRVCANPTLLASLPPATSGFPVVQVQSLSEREIRRLLRRAGHGR